MFPPLLKGNPVSKPSVTVQTRCGCGNAYITCILNSEGKIHGVAISLGKAGGCAAATTGTISNLVSLAAAHNLPIVSIINALKGASCHTANKLATPPILSCIDAIAEALEYVETHYADNCNTILK
jgi:TPP-dependent pyruvate/acetoin dehydrogenase alpha subunit